ncbi:hypothetical protein ACFWPV_24325 [Streptomyces uncialis]|uniref:hypothetical protein n=1 Tax=Streptomyces uncialis TaxID=1048205 RepID=UPI00364FDE06
MMRSPFAWILPTALAALLLALHLFTPVSPLAIAHSSERPTASAPAASAAVVHGVSATVAEAEPPTEAADSGSRALVRPRATRLVWSTPVHDRLRHRHPVEEPAPVLRARDRYRCDEAAPQLPPDMDRLGSVPAVRPPQAVGATDRTAVRLRPTTCPSELQVFRC